jgi:hypothetical protein
MVTAAMRNHPAAAKKSDSHHWPVACFVVNHSLSRYLHDVVLGFATGVMV